MQAMFSPSFCLSRPCKFTSSILLFLVWICARPKCLIYCLNLFRPTFRRIVRNKSTEQFSGLPYIYSLLNCLICMWYGLPCVSYGVILVATVNSFGAAFQFVYVVLFILHADGSKKVCDWFPRELFSAIIPNIRFISSVIALFAAEDVCTAFRCVWCFCPHCLCEPRAAWPLDTTSICGISKCCFTHLHVCFSIAYHCRSSCYS